MASDTDPLLLALASEYRRFSIAPVDIYPHLKNVTMAQWVKETGWNPSNLARVHLNFAGMKWRSVMADFAMPVEYGAHDGVDTYCKFSSICHFIQGYFARLDRLAAYNGWRDHTSTKNDFIHFIGPIWAPVAVNYANDILSIIPRLGEHELKINDL